VYALPPSDPAGQLQAIAGPSDSGTVLWETSRTTRWVSALGRESFPEWQHAWVDLTPWSGQTIRVEIRYTPGAAGNVALVDAISLSPWLTPLVRSIRPAWVIPSKAISATVEGANLSAGSVVYLGEHALDTEHIDSHILLVNVGSDLSRGRSDVVVVAGDERTSGLVQGFTVGGLLDLPLVLRR